MKNVLFVCSQNKLRSPTAEVVFSKRTDINVRSAGTNNDAEIPLGAEDVEWADIIFVMEKTHRNKLSKKFKSYLNNQRIIVLGIPDEYDFMDEYLIEILTRKVEFHLG